MKSRLVSLLVCTNCRSPLNLEARERRGEEILEGRLSCAGCGQEFPVRGGIPRFVASDDYVSTFSFEWKRWRRTQFDSARRQSSQATFTVSTGAAPGDLEGKLVLDAGCGAGRFMDVVARAGAEVVGVDLSLAVEAAQENLGSLPNCHFIQADLRRLPFRPETFDFFYSIGVLDHSPDTRESFMALVPALKCGGRAAIWVFPRRRLSEAFRYFPSRVNEVLSQDASYRISPRLEPWLRRLAGLMDWTMDTSSEIQRAITKRLPARWVYGLCHAAIPLYYVYRVPIFYPLRLLTKVAMDPDPEWRVLDTFDWYSTRYLWRHTWPEVRGWFEEAGFEEILLLPRLLAVRGKKSKTNASPSPLHRPRAG